MLVCLCGYAGMFVWRYTNQRGISLFLISRSLNSSSSLASFWCCYDVAVKTTMTYEVVVTWHLNDAVSYSMQPVSSCGVIDAQWD